MLKFGRKSDMNFRCTIRLLEDTDILECEFNVSDKGRILIDKVCELLKLVEKDYFGLRYVDSTHQRHWLDPTKSIFKQVKDLDTILFSFRVKFYPPDPFRLKEDSTRSQLYLQIKRDLLHGRLYCNATDSALLAAHIIQVEFGDYDKNEFIENYVNETKLLLKQTPQIEEKIMDIHQNMLKGQDTKKAETNFLKKAVTLDTYGIDPHPVKDHKGNQLYLGINYSGIVTFQGSKKSHHFQWKEVHKLNFEGKMFIIHLVYFEKKHTIGFKCPTGAACRHVWRCTMEQMLFFTSPSSSSIPSVVTGGSFFSFGAKLRYSGRVEKEMLSDSTSVFSGEELETSTGGRKAISVPATPSTPLADLGSNSLPCTNLSGECRLDSTFRSQTFATFPESSGFLTDLGPLNESDCKDKSNYLLNINEPCVNFISISSHEPLIDSGMQVVNSSKQLHKTSNLPSNALLLSTNQANVSRYSKLQFLKIFLPAFIVAALLVVTFFVIMFETDTKLLSALRRVPEIVILRVHYYEHLKKYFKSCLSSLPFF